MFYGARPLKGGRSLPFAVPYDSKRSNSFGCSLVHTHFEKCTLKLVTLDRIRSSEVPSALDVLYRQESTSVRAPASDDPLPKCSSQQNRFQATGIDPAQSLKREIRLLLKRAAALNWPNLIVKFMAIYSPDSIGLSGRRLSELKQRGIIKVFQSLNFNGIWIKRLKLKFRFEINFEELES